MNEDKFHRIRESFSTTLRDKRHHAKLSQEELAFKAGLAMRFISLLETGKRQPTLTTMAQLCDALDISLSEFVADMEKRL